MTGTRFYLLLIVFLLTACGKRSNRNNPVTMQNDPRPAAVLTPSEGGIVNLSLTNGQGHVLVRKAPRQTVYLDFATDGYRKMSAAITPQTDSAANLRISQVILPDGTADGPFGSAVQVAVPSSGSMRLVIGESLMQGDPWGGVFEVKISLER